MYGLRFIKPIRDLARIFISERSPRQLAGGLAIGVLIGCVPKGNLLAIMLSVLMFTFRVNLGTALTSICLVTLASPYFYPLTHRLGLQLLSMPTVYHMLVQAYQWPLVPWSDLHNTLVIGGFVLGLVLLYPCYHVGLAIINWSTPYVKATTEKLAEIRRRRRDDSSVPPATTDGVA